MVLRLDINTGVAVIATTLGVGYSTLLILAANFAAYTARNRNGVNQCQDFLAWNGVLVIFSRIYLAESTSLATAIMACHFESSHIRATACEKIFYKA